MQERETNKLKILNDDIQRDLNSHTQNMHEIIVGCVKDVELLFKAQPEVLISFLNYQNPLTKMTLLHTLVFNLSFHPSTFWLTKFLLKISANPNLPDLQGNTVLHLVVKALEINVCKYFFYDVCNDKINTFHNDFENVLNLIGVLIAGGANPNIKNYNHINAFQYLSSVVNKFNYITGIKIYLDMDIIKNQYISTIYSANKSVFCIGINSLFDKYETIKLEEGVDNFNRYAYSNHIQSNNMSKSLVSEVFIN